MPDNPELKKVKEAIPPQGDEEEGARELEHRRGLMCQKAGVDNDGSDKVKTVPCVVDIIRSYQVGGGE